MKTITNICAILSIAIVLIATGCDGNSSNKDFEQNWLLADTIKIDSGKVLFSDPGYLPDILDDISVQLDDLPVGHYDVFVSEVIMGEFGPRISRARVVLQGHSFKEGEVVGSAGVDSGIMAVLDPSFMTNEWIMVGPDRKGSIGGTDKEEIAYLLAKQGYKLGASDEWSITLVDPVTENDEEKINQIIDSNNLYGHLHINTGGSYYKACDALYYSNWGSLSFANGSPGFAVVCSSGIGDGLYPVHTLYDEGVLVGAEIVFEDHPWME